MQNACIDEHLKELEDKEHVSSSSLMDRSGELQCNVGFILVFEDSGEKCIEWLQLQILDMHFGGAVQLF